MRILVVGAGAIGGYFGGRLLEAGADVTFLVRARRAAQLETDGLIITSPHGDVRVPRPALVTRDNISAPFDLIIVACKAYDLADTIDSFASAVGPDTAVLPLLNGMRHIDTLTARFGEARVLGGHCVISAVLEPSGVIAHLNDLHTLTFGELDGAMSARVAAINAAFARANFVSIASADIRLEMWEKWVLIASMGCINSLMRAAIGDIVAAGASDLALGMYREACAIAALNGHAPRATAMQRAEAILTTTGSTLTASLLKDVEAGRPTEAEHIVGDLLTRGGGTVHDRALLRIAHAHLRARDVRQAREERGRGTS